MNLRATILATALSGLALVQGAHAQVPAATGSAGPYYATPSWDQKLPSATRFIVLSNWGGQAALDRETGLVWELAPRPATTFLLAYWKCQGSTVGNRGGWRLPTFEELMRTLVAGPSAEAITDSPFQLGTGSTSFWSSTVSATDATTRAFLFRGRDGLLGPGEAIATGSITAGFWCVQSPGPGSLAP